MTLVSPRPGSRVPRSGADLGPPEWWRNWNMELPSAMRPGSQGSTKLWARSKVDALTDPIASPWTRGGWRCDRSRTQEVRRAVNDLGSPQASSPPYTSWWRWTFFRPREALPKRAGPLPGCLSPAGGGGGDRWEMASVASPASLGPDAGGGDSGDLHSLHGWPLF